LKRKKDVRNASPALEDVPDAILEISDLCKAGRNFLKLHEGERGELHAVMCALFLRIDGLTDELAAAT